jgi:hypothetical protein
MFHQWVASFIKIMLIVLHFRVSIHIITVFNVLNDSCFSCHVKIEIYYDFFVCMKNKIKCYTKLC